MQTAGRRPHNQTLQWTGPAEQSLWLEAWSAPGRPLNVGPFGGQALTGGQVSKVIVKKPETFRLGFWVLLHVSPADRPVDLPAADKDYLKQSAEECDPGRVTVPTV